VGQPAWGVQHVASRGGQIDQLAHRWKVRTRSREAADGGLTLTVAGNIYRGTSRLAVTTLVTPAGKYVCQCICRTTWCGGWIYISTSVGPETYLRGLRRGRVRSGPGCLHGAPGALGARAHHPSQTVRRAWPGPGTNGSELTLNPPVAAVHGRQHARGPPPAGASACPAPPGPHPAGAPACPGGPVDHVTKPLLFSLSPLKTGPSQSSDHPHS
jgi:hypothetical protein